jgi:hypothetical protein
MMNKRKSRKILPLVQFCLSIIQAGRKKNVRPRIV